MEAPGNFPIWSPTWNPKVGKINGGRLLNGAQQEVVVCTVGVKVQPVKQKTWSSQTSNTDTPQSPNVATPPGAQLPISHVNVTILHYYSDLGTYYKGSWAAGDCPTASKQSILQPRTGLPRKMSRNCSACHGARCEEAALGHNHVYVRICEYENSFIYIHMIEYGYS